MFRCLLIHACTHSLVFVCGGGDSSRVLRIPIKNPTLYLSYVFLSLYLLISTSAPPLLPYSASILSPPPLLSNLPSHYDGKRRSKKGQLPLTPHEDVSRIASAITTSHYYAHAIPVLLNPSTSTHLCGHMVSSPLLRYHTG